MLTGPKQIVYFELAEGQYPFLDWLLGLKDRRTRHRIDARLTKLELGNPGHWRSVGGGVIELKESFGPGYRLYLAEDGPVIVVLLAGGTKSGQSRDVALAQAYWARFLAAKRGSEHA